ncbi:hypothetical protein DL771_001585 [Monosporascus sp. 5C6A]|nr:hypothetical protein DL771_001585 [Monosporascus sp. 5C6A]
MGCIVYLLLALRWGGSQYPWNDGRIVALFVVCGISFTGAVVHQQWKGEEATIPTRLLRNRSFDVSLFNGFCMASAQFTVLYYVGFVPLLLPTYTNDFLQLPLWFQAVQGDTAEDSGIHTLPLVLSVIGVALLAGIGVSIFGYTAPFIIAATVLSAVGAGMLYTLMPEMPSSKWIGYQILFGSGSGTGIQQAIVGAQVSVVHSDVAYAIAVLMLANTIGGAIFICVCQNLFLAEMSNVAAKVPDLDLGALTSGFASVRAGLSPEDLRIVQDGYNTGIQRRSLWPWYFALSLC